MKRLTDGNVLSTDALELTDEQIVETCDRLVGRVLASFKGTSLPSLLEWDDVSQEAYIEILGHMRRGARNDNVIVKQATYSVLKKIHKAQAEDDIRRELDQADFEREYGYANAPDADDQELLWLCVKALLELPHQDREIVRRHWMFDESFRDIALALEEPWSTIREKAYKGLAQIRAQVTA